MKKDQKQSFIAEARREQIIEAAIQTLDDVGYVKASLSQIAKRAGISTGLISYHFADKEDLMNHLLENLLESSTSYILECVEQADSPIEKVEAFIMASLAYQGTHPKRYTALIEIIFNARTEDNVPYYKMGDDDDDPIMGTLTAILKEGQKNGDFGPFHVDVMANLIQGAIGEYMLNANITKTVDLETFSSEVVSIVKQAMGVQ
ncbi:TetR/AcrR family transcriptional regulator [Planococcus sp. YIM B11945]|uniref:TetR/AcrR family transcriptional regulator n=1 Tax=Planococcus sp. YIM B11945 TaxID=3435410 RepID=UPI003D7D767A